MGSKNKQLAVWNRFQSQPVNVRYSEEDFLLDPKSLLEDATSKYLGDSFELSQVSSSTNDIKNAEKRLTLGELRRRFWHLRNRGKKLLRKRREKHHQFEAPKQSSEPEKTKALTNSDVEELFDSSLQRSRLEFEIQNLYTRIESDSTTEKEKIQLLQHLYKAGHLRSAASFIRENQAALYAEAVPKDPVINRILADIDLLNNLPQIPDRGDGPIVVPEKGRVLYCAASTIHYHSNGYATRTSGLVGGLKSLGADIIVAARPGYPWDVKAHRAYKKSIFHIKHADGVEYAYSFGPSLKTQSISQYLEHSIDAYLRLIERYRPSHIHAASNHMTALPALIAARIAGLPFTYEVRGFWEYALQDTLGRQNERRLLATKLEDLVLGNADHIFILSPEMKMELESRGYESSIITVLPNGVDTDVFQPLPKVGDLVSEYNLDDGKFNIGYAGSMVAYEGLDVLTDAALELAKERDDFRLVLVGDGPVLPAVEKKLSESKTPLDVQILGRVAPAAMPGLISSFDLTVAARKSTEVTRLVSPLKPLESMAAGVPFIASDLPVLRGLITESQGGILFEGRSSSSLAAQIRELLNDPSSLTSMGRIAREWTIHHRQWPAIARQLLEKFQGQTAPTERIGKYLSEITVGIIADEFTMTSFAGTSKLVTLERRDWLKQLATEDIDVVFVESAWKGNGGQWTRGVGHYSQEESEDLEKLVKYCKEHSVPTIFWNKEDPVHFERFKRNAMLFDLVLTTDSRSIPRYQALQNSPQQKFGSLPFFATPRVHHPVTDVSREQAQVVYAGSYYGDRYPERSESLLKLLEAAKLFQLNIFDRQADNPDSPYKFPPDLQRYVMGGLPYEEMLDAYRKYPIHLNVNSVTRSETMFSRRVVEIGMSGGLVMSSPSVAMSMLFSGLVPQAQSAHDARELLSMATSSPELRNMQGWNLRRLVRRSHSVYTRLATILRRAGLNVKALPEAKVGVVLKSGSRSIDLQSLTAQTFPPQSIHIDGDFAVSEEVREELRAQGIQLVSSVHDLSKLDYIFHWNGTFLDSEILEDAVFLSEDVSSLEVHIDTSRPTSISTPLASPSTPDSSGHSYLRYVGDEAGRSLRVSLHRGMISSAYPENNYQIAPIGENLEHLVEKLHGKKVLVAGHDLKFILPIVEKLRSLGIIFEIDQWQTHNTHDEERSRKLLEDVDVVFCEWGLGNAVWYSRNVRDDQRLVVRVHSQELFRSYLSRIESKAVDEMVFVSPHIRDAAQNIKGISNIKSRVVPNFVRDDSVNAFLSGSNRFTLGLVGVVPQQKGLDKALTLLEILRSHDQRFNLRVKGKLPEDYPWMLSRHDEMAFYDAQYQRIASNPLLENAVHFDGYSSEWSDMMDWYRSVGLVISVSDFESFHYTLVDGPLNGALPISLRWPGADRLYPESWLVNDIPEMSDQILSSVADIGYWSAAVKDAQEFVRNEYDSMQTIKQLLESLSADSRGSR